MPRFGKKRTRNVSDGDSSGDDSDSDYNDSRSKVKKPQKQKKPPTKAHISILATDTSANAADALRRVNNIDPAIMQRIKKALTLASHESTGEDEARAALRMASKLLERHNVTQADVMAQETESEKIKRAGRSVISVKCTNPDRPIKVSAESWAMEVSEAMCIFFDCRFYYTTFDERTHVDYHFYGLAEQTVAAAYAFEMAYNLIIAWSFGKRIANSVHARNCYRTGVADGLEELALKEKEDEKAKAVRKEQALLEARKKMEEEDDKSRIKRLDGPETQVKKEERVSVTVKKKEDVDDKSWFEQVRPSAVDAKLEDVKAVKIEEDEKGVHPSRVTSHSNPRSSKAGVKIEEIEDEDVVRAARDKDSFDQSNLASFSAENMFGFESDDDSDYHPTSHYPTDSERTYPPPKPESSSTEMMPPPVSTQPLAEQGKEDDPMGNPEPESPWDSGGQLVAFRDTSLAIADDYLKSEGIKVTTGGATYFSYTEEGEKFLKLGKADARKIDVRRKRIKYMDEE